MPVYLVGDTKGMVWSKRSVMLLIRSDVYIIQLIKLFENLNSISNIFRDPPDFLVFSGSLTIYISLRSSQPKVPRKKTKTNGRFLDKGNVHTQNY